MSSRGRAAALLCLSLALVGAQQAQAAAPAHVFHSPAERSAIEARRRALLDAEQRSAAAAKTTGMAPVRSGAAGEPPAGAALRGRLDGVAVAHGTRSAAWIGGRRLVDGARYGAYRLRVAGNGVQLIGLDGRVRFVSVGNEVAP